MSVITIQEAKRSGARLVIGLCGVSGGGKTFTGIQLGYGLAGGDGAKVGLLCTENKRGRLYASKKTYEMVQKSLGLKKLPAPFLVGDFYAPFSPQRYIDAILEFQKAGVKVLVIDSATHEWEGTGGCHEIANPPGSNLKLPRWDDAKAEHKRFMNVLLQCDMDIIVCIRAREKVKLVKVNGKTEFEPQGVMPVQEGNFMFEMTASMMLWDGGRTQDVLKCPDELTPILGRGQGFLTAADGFALRKWVDGADDQPDAEVEAARNSLRTLTEKGSAAIAQEWKNVPRRIQKILDADGTLAELRSSAEAYDKARAQASPGGESLAGLNAEMAEAGAA
jgi:hypothetical protein